MCGLAIFGQLITGHDPALARSHVLRNAPALGVSPARRSGSSSAAAAPAPVSTRSS